MKTDQWIQLLARGAGPAPRGVVPARGRLSGAADRHQRQGKEENAGHGENQASNVAITARSWSSVSGAQNAKSIS